VLDALPSWPDVITEEDCLAGGGWTAHGAVGNCAAPLMYWTAALKHCISEDCFSSLSLLLWWLLLLLLLLLPASS